MNEKQVWYHHGGLNAKWDITKSIMFSDTVHAVGKYELL